MTISSLAMSMLAVGMLCVILLCYARAAFNQPFSASLLIALLFTLTCALSAVAGWSNLAGREPGLGLAQLGGAAVVAIVGMYVQKLSKPRAMLTMAIVQRVAPNDSKRLLFFLTLFLVALAATPWLFSMGHIDRLLISLCFGALFALITCLIEFESMHRAGQ